MLVGIAVQRALLVDNAFSVLVAELHLVYRISLAFFSSFAEIQRFELPAGDTGQRITHFEEKVNLLVRVRLEVGLQARLSLIYCIVHCHLCPSGIDPDKLPVELKLITESLSRLYGVVLCATLCICSNPSNQEA